MSDFINQFSEHLTSKEASPKTIVNYLADIRHFAKWFRETNAQELPLKEITPTDIRDYRGYLNSRRCWLPPPRRRHLRGIQHYRHERQVHRLH